MGPQTMAQGYWEEGGPSSKPEGVAGGAVPGRICLRDLGTRGERLGGGARSHTHTWRGAEGPPREQGGRAGVGGLRGGEEEP